MCYNVTELAGDILKYNKHSSTFYNWFLKNLVFAYIEEVKVLRTGEKSENINGGTLISFKKSFFGFYFQNRFQQCFKIHTLIRII